jgi:hypothetical protein
MVTWSEYGAGVWQSIGGIFPLFGDEHTEGRLGDRPFASLKEGVGEKAWGPLIYHRVPRSQWDRVGLR